jgi:hypothetical protein
MARHKDWWKGWLLSYGPKYDKGEAVGFHIAIKADDRTETGRVVDIGLNDKSAESLRNVLTEYLASRSKTE